MSHQLTSLVRTRFATQAGLYTLSNLVNAAIPFLLIPVLTRHLAPEEYGIVGLFQVLTGLAGAFIGVGFTGVSRQYLEEDVDFPQYVGNGFLILIASATVTAAGLWALGGAIESLIEFPVTALWAVVVFCASQAALNVLLDIWRMKERPIPFCFLQFALAMLNLVITLYLVVSLRHGWEGRVHAQVAAYGLFGIIATAYLANAGMLRLRPNRAAIHHALAYGMPLIPHTIGGFIYMMGDRIFLTRMVGLEATGVYVVGYQVGMVVLILANSFNLACQPWIFKRLKEGGVDVKTRVVRYVYVYFAAILLFAVAFGMLAPWFLGALSSDRYVEAASVVFWIALGFAFNGMYKMVASFIFYSQKTNYLAVSTFMTMVISIVSNYYMIHAFGMIGAAYSTCLSLAFSFLCTWLMAARLIEMPWLAAVGIRPVGGTR